MLTLDALPYRFDPRTGRYRWTDGASKGKLAPRKAILSLTDRYIKSESDRLIEVGRSWVSGAIDDRTFQVSAAEIIRQVTIGAAILGANGIDNLKNQDWQRIQETIKRNLYKGRDKDGKPFGLRQLMRDRLSGEASDAQFLARLKMLANAARLAFHQEDAIAQAKAGATECRRILGVAEHCQDCIDYAAIGWIGIDRLILPGDRCACRSNCKCRVEFRTRKIRLR